MKFGPWKIWNGGKYCPVDRKTKVQTQLRRETRAEAETKKLIRAECLFWHLTTCSTSIIAYREVIEPVPKTVTGYAHYSEATAALFCPTGNRAAHARITYDVVDGKIDWSTLRAEPIK